MFLTRLRTRTRALHTTTSRLSDFASYKKSSAAPVLNHDTYAKQLDETPEPRVSHAGTRTYVVAPKESASYDVPGGAYGSSDPYLTPPQTPAPQTSDGALASTAPGAAHPNTTQRVPRHPDGVGASAAVRFRSAPGAMAPGSDGGLGLMDAAGTQGTNELAGRNEPPGEEGGRRGNAEAWKYRK